MLLDFLKEIERKQHQEEIENSTTLKSSNLSPGEQQVEETKVAASHEAKSAAHTMQVQPDIHAKP